MALHTFEAGVSVIERAIETEGRQKKEESIKLADILPTLTALFT